MTQMQAIQQAVRLQRIWIGDTDLKAGKGFDLNRIHASMMQEYRYIRTRADRKGVTAETHGQLVLLGKIRKALA